MGGSDLFWGVGRGAGRWDSRTLGRELGLGSRPASPGQ